MQTDTEAELQATIAAIEAFDPIDIASYVLVGSPALAPVAHPAPPPRNDSPYLSIAEAADMLRIKPKAAYMRAQRGQMPGLRRDPAGGLLVKRAVLVSFIERSVSAPIEGGGA